MRIEQLAYLRDLYETHSISQTAARFFISQQAVSNSMKQLENELGCVLLERSATGVILTPQGQKNLLFAQNVLEQYTHLKLTLQEMDASTAHERHFLDFISASAVITNIFPLIKMDAFHKQFPYIDIRLTETAPEEAFQIMAQGHGQLAAVSCNTELFQALEKTYAPASVLILAQDQLVACILAAASLSKMQSIDSDCILSHPHTIFSVVPKKEYSEITYLNAICISNDLAFHEKMLRQGRSQMAIMPACAFKIFFNNRRFMSLAIDEPTDLIHALLLPPNPPESVQQFALLIKNYFLKNA